MSPLLAMHSFKTDSLALTLDLVNEHIVLFNVQCCDSDTDGTVL